LRTGKLHEKFVRLVAQCERYNSLMPETEIIFSVQESPEGGYEARALGYSIFTQADTMEELKRNVREAVHCHFDEGQAPSVIRLHTVKDEVIPA
jgi:hypothetical protein